MLKHSWPDFVCGKVFACRQVLKDAALYAEEAYLLQPANVS